VKTAKQKVMVQREKCIMDFKQVDVFPYLKTRCLCVLLHYLKVPLVIVQ